jgi:hypothetical protein
MSEFSVSPLRTNSVAYLHRLREAIQLDPIYQRQGEVWSRSKQRLLIDSIINRFDIPKIYVHEHDPPQEIDGRRIRYSLVDGRQRLEAIWEFLDGKLALADDFVLLEDGADTAAGKTYSEIEDSTPEIAALFAATSLDVMVIRTGDIELIEEMFSRLNEAVPLNAAEKRNGRGGPLRAVVRQLVSEQEFFQDRVPFTNSRYRHFDLCTKFLYWVDEDGPADSKKAQLDQFWDEIRSSKSGKKRAADMAAGAGEILGAMSTTFESRDKLLASIGMVSVYFLLYKDLLELSLGVPNRSDLTAFEAARRLRRYEDEEALPEPKRRLLEFDRLSQSPNDEGALSFRVKVLKDFLKDPASFQ